MEANPVMKLLDLYHKLNQEKVCARMILESKADIQFATLSVKTDKKSAGFFAPKKRKSPSALRRSKARAEKFREKPNTAVDISCQVNEMDLVSPRQTAGQRSSDETQTQLSPSISREAARTNTPWCVRKRKRVESPTHGKDDITGVTSPVIQLDGHVSPVNYFEHSSSPGVGRSFTVNERKCTINSGESDAESLQDSEGENFPVFIPSSDIQDEECHVQNEECHVQDEECHEQDEECHESYEDEQHVDKDIAEIHSCTWSSFSCNACEINPSDIVDEPQAAAFLTSPHMKSPSSTMNSSRISSTSNAFILVSKTSPPVLDHPLTGDIDYDYTKKMLEGKIAVAKTEFELVRIERVIRASYPKFAFLLSQCRDKSKNILYSDLEKTDEATDDDDHFNDLVSLVKRQKQNRR